MVLIGVGDDRGMKAELPFELSEAPFDKAEHVVAKPGVNDQDPLSSAGLRGDDYAAISLSDIDKYNLKRTRASDVFRPDEKAFGAPENGRPTVWCLLFNIEKVSPSDITYT